VLPAEETGRGEIGDRRREVGEGSFRWGCGSGWDGREGWIGLEIRVRIINLCVVLLG